MLQKLFVTLNSRHYFVYKKCCASLDSDQKDAMPCFLYLQNIWDSKIGNLIIVITVKCAFFYQTDIGHMKNYLLILNPLLCKCTTFSLLSFLMMDM